MTIKCIAIGMAALLLSSSAAALADTEIPNYTIVDLPGSFSSSVNRWGIAIVDTSVREQTGVFDVGGEAHALSSGAGPRAGRVVTGTEDGTPVIFEVAMHNFSFVLQHLNSPVGAGRISASGEYVGGNELAPGQGQFVNRNALVWILPTTPQDSDLVPVEAIVLSRNVSVPPGVQCNPSADFLHFTVDDINDHGEAIGLVSCVGDGDDATFSVYWADPTADPVGFTSNYDLTAINDNGEIVGNEGNRPVYWPSAGAEPVPLDDFGSFNDINNEGVIVGRAEEGAVIWTTDGSKRVVLDEIVPPSSPLLGSALAISDCGQIVGDYEEGGAFFAIPVGDDVDTDGDQLFDRWETCGIDAQELDGNVNGPDGITDFVLLNANPKRKDLYVEADAMSSDIPPDGVLSAVVQAFAEAPVNTESTELESGIALHIPCDQDPNNPDAEKDACVDDRTIPFKDTWDMTADGHHFGSDFATNRSVFFGSLLESDDANWDNIKIAKAYTHKYGVFIHNFGQDGEATKDIVGVAILKGSEFVVAVGTLKLLEEGFEVSAEEVAAPFMHELGHTLGLNHGGAEADEHFDFKPNYFSMMNGTWVNAVPGHIAAVELAPLWASWCLTYSPPTKSCGDGGLLNTLDEKSLSESSGIGSSKARLVYVSAAAESGSTMGRTVSMQGPIDWNDDGDKVDTQLVEDVNNISEAGGTLDTLRDNDDWASIKQFVNPTDSLMTQTDPDPFHDATIEQIQALRHLTFDCNGNGVDDKIDIANHTSSDENHNYIDDACEGEVLPPDLDGDGINDDIDNCTAAANLWQQDSDFDGYGNACDPDLNNDCVVNFLDLGLLEEAFFSDPTSPNWNPSADFNGDGFVNFVDLGIQKALFFGAPGPSADTTVCSTPEARKKREASLLGDSTLP